MDVLLATLLSLPCTLAISPQDAWRFPADPVIREQREFGAAFRARLLPLIDAEPHHPEHRRAYEESLRAEEVWAVLWLVRPAPVSWGSPPGPCTVLHLTRLREFLGPEAYQRGELPPIAPEWYLLWNDGASGWAPPKVQ